jgi:hypothetical protein
VKTTPYLRIPYPDDHDVPDGASQASSIALHLDNMHLIKSVTDDTDRTTKFPTPRNGQVVWNVASAAFQQYITGTGWIRLTKFAAMPTFGYSMVQTSGTQTRPSRGWVTVHGTYTGMTDAQGKLAIPLPSGAIPSTVLGAVVCNGNTTQTKGQVTVSTSAPTTDKATLYVVVRMSAAVVAATTVTVNFVVWGY